MKRELGPVVESLLDGEWGIMDGERRSKWEREGDRAYRYSPYLRYAEVRRRSAIVGL